MPQKRLILILQISIGFLAAGYGVMFTMLDDWREQFGISETGLGFIVAIGFFTSFFAQLTIAPLADKGHARRLLTYGVALNVVGCIVMGYSTAMMGFVGGRFLMGVGAGMAIPAIKRIVIVSDPENIGKNLGRGVAIEVGGFALGPMISALTIGTFGLAAPFLILATILVVMVIAIARETILETAVEDQPDERFALDLLRIRPLAGAILIGVALYVMIGVFDPLWVVMMDDLDAPSWVGNAGVSIFGLPWILFATVGGTIAQKYGPFRISAFGLAIGACYMASYGFIGSPYVMLGVAVTQSALDALTVTGTGIAVAHAAPPQRQAGASGLLGGIQTLTGGIVALAAGSVYEHFGRGVAFGATGIVMFSLVCVGCLLAGPKLLRRPLH